jgi:hypothetical protein
MHGIAYYFSMTQYMEKGVNYVHERYTLCAAARDRGTAKNNI